MPVSELNQPTTSALREGEMSFRESLFGEARHKGRRFSLGRGACLQAPGAAHAPLFLIETGAAHLYVDTSMGPQTLRLGYPGEMLAALPGLLLGIASPIAIETLRACTGFALSRAQLDAFLDRDPQHRTKYLATLEGMVCGLLERELDLLEPDPATRYAKVFRRSPQLFANVPLRYIASYLRMTPETLSRVRRQVKS